MNPFSTFLIPFNPSRADFPTSYHCTKKITLERLDSFPSTMEKDIKIRTIKVTGRKKSFIFIFIDSPYPFYSFRKKTRMLDKTEEASGYYSTFTFPTYLVHWLP